MFRKVIVAGFVLLFAVVGIPSQAGVMDTGDVQKQGAYVVPGAPADANRSVIDDSDLPLGTTFQDDANGLYQAGGNSDGVTSDVFGGTGVSTAVSVPEPGTIILGGLGMLMLILARGATRFARNQD